jgi:hypothetical protein
MMSLALYGISAVSKENKINKRNRRVWEKQSEPPAQRHHKTAHMFIHDILNTLSEQLTESQRIPICASTGRRPSHIF